MPSLQQHQNIYLLRKNKNINKYKYKPLHHPSLPVTKLLTIYSYPLTIISLAYFIYLTPFSFGPDLFVSGLMKTISKCQELLRIDFGTNLTYSCLLHTLVTSSTQHKLTILASIRCSNALTPLSRTFHQITYSISIKFLTSARL